MYEVPENIVALVTPMDFEQQIDLNGLKRLLDLHANAGTEALLLFGSTGEGLLLSDQEREKILNFVCHEYQWVGSIWVSCSHQSLPGVMSYIKQANSFEVDGVMVSTPMYIKPSQSGIIAYFTMLADQSPLPVMLYNVPSRTGCAISVSTANVLSHHENIIGIKETDVSIERMVEYQNCASNFVILSGDDISTLSAMGHGAWGSISVTGNLFPKLVKEMISAYKGQVHDVAQLIDKGFYPMNDLFSILPNPAAIKWMLSEKGLIASVQRSPLVALTMDQQMQLETVLASTEALEQLSE